MQTALVVNIQRFSLHDGPGVRTTIFFKGCPLSCLWCHNPESRSFLPEIMFFEDRCQGCGRCEAACPSKDRCTGCGACADACLYDARQLVGRAYTPEALYEIALRDQGLYDLNGGGVTLSGGEVMAQDMDFVTSLMRLLKKRGIHIAVDTCGCAAWENFERVLPHTDLFLYDLKAYSPSLHKKLTGRHNAAILENLENLAKAGTSINLRVPVVPGANADPAEMRDLARYAFGATGSVPVNLLPYHRVGSDKAERLHQKAVLFEPPTGAQMAEIETIFREAGFDQIKIGG